MFKMMLKIPKVVAKDGCYPPDLLQYGHHRQGDQPQPQDKVQLK